MPVNTTHPEYDKYAEQWRVTRDAATGFPAIKLRNEYLPVPFQKTEPERFAEYKARAYFLGTTGRTERAMIGMVFRKSYTKEIPQGMEFLLENFDGAGNSVEQVAKDCLSGLLEARRHLLLVDYPDVPVNLSREEQAAFNVRPFVTTYVAEALINWRFDVVGGVKKLAMAVLKEIENVSGDEFGHDYEERFRVLRLIEGKYCVQVYDEKQQPITELLFPQAGGKYLDHIPLHGVRELETPPLYDIACVNIAHYRNVADLEDAAFVVGQPMLSVDIGETDPILWKEQNPNGVTFGSRRGVITKKGKLELVQAQENNLCRTIKQDKEAEMVMLGAQLIQRGGQAETAEAARLNAAAEASVLDTLVNDLSEDIEAALEDCARFLGIDQAGVQFTLNTDYWETGLSPQAFMAVVQGYQANLYAQTDAIEMIRTGKIGISAERTTDDVMTDTADLLTEA